MFVPLPLAALPVLAGVFYADLWALINLMAYVAYGAALAAGAAGVVWGLVAAKGRVAREPATVVVLGEALAAFLLSVAGVPSRVGRYLDFRWHEGQRAELVRQVETGEIAPVGRCCYAAPQSLSRTGHVLVQRDGDVVSIFFYRQVGLLGDGEGFLYRSDGNEPPPSGLFNEWPAIGVSGRNAERLDARWFWVTMIGMS